MKKYLVIMLFAMAAFGFVGCNSDDNTKADIQWNNQAGVGNYVNDIKWISSGKEDQSWDGKTDNNESTSFKGITELTGQGDCYDNTGNPATIELRNDSTGTTVATGDKSATIQENANAVLIIDTTSAK